MIITKALFLNAKGFLFPKIYLANFSSVFH